MQYVLAGESSRAKKCKKKRRGVLAMLGDWITGPLDKLFYLIMTDGE